MSLKQAVKKWRNDYVIAQVRRAKVPDFAPSPLRRYQIRFSGRVQKVGFRLEVEELSKRLGLAGFCENLPNGDVLAQLQGEEKKISFLLDFMSSLKRIKITERVMEELPVDSALTGFARR